MHLFVSRVIVATVSLIFVLALTACGSRTPPPPPPPPPMPPPPPPLAAPKAIPPTLTTAAGERVHLLFYHEPNSCPHCAYEKGQIRQFQQSHPEVDVVWRTVNEPLSNQERALLSGTSGHPIMAFWAGDSGSSAAPASVDIGETSAAELAHDLFKFLEHLHKARELHAELKKTKTNRGATCP